MKHNIRFEFLFPVHYEAYYEVYGDGPPYRIVVHRHPEDWHRRYFAGTDAQWQRDVVAAAGLVSRHGSGDPISPALVATFKEWRAADHAHTVRQLLSRPEHYGVRTAEDPRLPPPTPVRGAYFVVERGWVEIDSTHARLSQTPASERIQRDTA